MDVRNVDLNLLVVLQQLLKEKHVSRAAQALHLSQPAVSRALQRLRRTFDDPLLVRSKSGYALSARASALQPQLDAVLEAAGKLLSGPTFEPARSTDTIRIYGPDPEIGWFLPPLFAHLRHEAPQMRIHVRSDPTDHFALLDPGQAHFVISPLEPTSGMDQVHRTKLADLKFAVLMSADHPLAKRRLTIQAYIDASHGTVPLAQRGIPMVEEVLQAAGHLRPGESLKRPLRLSSFTSIADFCEQSDLLFTLPKRYAERLAGGRNLIVRDVSPAFRPRAENVYLYWHERFHKDPMCIWLREQLRAVHGLGKPRY